MKLAEKWWKLMGALFCCVFLLTCQKVKEHPVPDSSVNVTINLMDGEVINAFQKNNGVLYLPENLPVRDQAFYKYECGYGGIVVYKEGSDYVAYDRTCTYNVGERCKVGSSDGTIVKCPCCDSEYLLLTGEVMGGCKASIPLRKYRVQISDGKLYISR